jgi:rhamnogalacturonyl hydrolase YesR
MQQPLPRVLFVVLLSALPGYAQIVSTTVPSILPRDVLASMEQVADWQLAHPSSHPATHWPQSAFYVGVTALTKISAQPRYHDAMMKMGETTKWDLGPRKTLYHADDQCVGQTYVDLYMQHHDPKMIGPLKQRLDFILTYPKDDNLVFDRVRNPDYLDRWAWCDSLFMAPPTWLGLSIATGDKAYMDFAVRKWWITSDYLFDKPEGLFFRDSSYFDQREANGRKVFWSRGNGWVMAGLVRVINYLPKDHPDRSRFIGQFRTMASKILACQQADGLWRASLLDPASYPLQETSGSAFFCYAFTWGVNEGLLEREVFTPAALKAWTALRTCVNPDGKLTHVQPIGADPKHFSKDATEAYGVGAYLLAGSEIYRLVGDNVRTPDSAAKQGFLPASFLGFDLMKFERDRVISAAEIALSVEPRTIVSVRNPRSAGGLHDFSSEGDYWWPDPRNPDGPYIRRDGETNPDNFVAHRRLLSSFARTFGALAAAYDLSRDDRYAQAAVRNLHAWFVAPETRMNPDLQYAQAVKGVVTGRGTGIIDTVHLAEVALGVKALWDSPAFAGPDKAAVFWWFNDYLQWIRVHPYGIAESKAGNNHGVCWALQAAAFARLTDNDTVISDCRRRYKEEILPNQMAADGSFPREIARTKPYGYSIFTLDTVSALAVVLSSAEENFLTVTTSDGRSLSRGVEFLFPYFADKSRWPYLHDVTYWADWPIRQPALLFGALAYGRAEWLELWKRLPSDSEVEEVRRNFPVRYPTLWLRHLGLNHSPVASND